MKEETDLPDNGAGVRVYVKVDDVEDFYNGVLAAGLKPASEIREPSRGQREFTLRDPDGYRLVFFQKK